MKIYISTSRKMSTFNGNFLSREYFQGEAFKTFKAFKIFKIFSKICENFFSNNIRSNSDHHMIKLFENYEKDYIIRRQSQLSARYALLA